MADCIKVTIGEIKLVLPSRIYQIWVRLRGVYDTFMFETKYKGISYIINTSTEDIFEESEEAEEGDEEEVEETEEENITQIIIGDDDTYEFESELFWSSLVGISTSLPSNTKKLINFVFESDGLSLVKEGKVKKGKVQLNQFMLRCGPFSISMVNNSYNTISGYLEGVEGFKISKKIAKLMQILR